MFKRYLVLCILLISLLSAHPQGSASNAYGNLLEQLGKTGRDTNRVIVLLKISRFHLADTNETRNADSALLLARQAEEISNALNYNNGKGDSYLALGEGYLEKAESAQVRIFAQKAIELFTQTDNGQKLAAAYVLKGESYGEGEPAEKLHLFNTGLDIYRKAGDKTGQATTLQRIGEAEMAERVTPETIMKLKQSLALYGSVGYAPLQEIYALLSIAYTKTGNLNEALRYGLLAVKTVEDLKNFTKSTGIIYSYLAATYSSLGQIEECAFYLKKAIAIAVKYSDAMLITALSCNLSSYLIKLNKPLEALAYLKNVLHKYPAPANPAASVQVYSNLVDIYLTLKEYKNAGMYCTELLSVCQQLPETHPMRLTAYPYLIKYYFETKQYDQSAKYIPVLKQKSTVNSLVPTLRFAYLMSYKIDSARGNYSSALENYKFYKTYSDSLFSTARNKENSQLQIQYESEKKDQEIRLTQQNVTLLTKEGAMQKVRLQQADKLKNLTFAGIALLLIILFLLYSRYRLKQATNKKLEQRQHEIDQKNSSLHHLVEEKDWLVKEIHHRVKNNFHMVMGLLGTQSEYLESKEALEAIAESQHRIQAMSLVHQRLYQSENLSAINMAEYIHELVDYLRDSFRVGQTVHFNLQIDPIELDLSHCIPLGLIMNEAITNSLKYAFPDKKRGCVAVSFKSTIQNHLLLIIHDNGVGLPKNFDSRISDSMGLKLMRGLSDDIEASFTVSSSEGTEIRIDFAYHSDVLNWPESKTSKIAHSL